MAKVGRRGAGAQGSWEEKELTAKKRGVGIKDKGIITLNHLKQVRRNKERGVKITVLNNQSSPFTIPLNLKTMRRTTKVILRRH